MINNQAKLIDELVHHNTSYLRTKFKNTLRELILGIKGHDLRHFDYSITNLLSGKH